MLFATHIARRFLALIAAIAAFLAMWTFTDRPLVWEWMGRPNEVYPEMGFLVFGLPASLVAVGSGAYIAWKARASTEPSGALTIARILSFVALAICAWLSWFALSAFLTRA
ncbi:hypothetical protein D3C85_994290 [compost metagenome]